MENIEQLILLVGWFLSTECKGNIYLFFLNNKVLYCMQTASNAGR